MAGKPGQDTEGEARVLLEVVRNLKFRSCAPSTWWH